MKMIVNGNYFNGFLLQGQVDLQRIWSATELHFRLHQQIQQDDDLAIIAAEHTHIFSFSFEEVRCYFSDQFMVTFYFKTKKDLLQL
jgi:hypothetical protein